MEKWIKIIIGLVIFIASIALIVVNQKTVGTKNLGMMFVGLAGVLVLLFIYNKKYQ